MPKRARRSYTKCARTARAWPTRSRITERSLTPYSRSTPRAAWSGFAPPDIAATAWQSAIATGALAHMRYPEVAAVSTVYTLQGKFDAFNGSYIPLFDFSDPAMAATVRRMRVYMQTVVAYETALMAGYDSALVKLDGAGHDR